MKIDVLRQGGQSSGGSGTGLSNTGGSMTGPLMLSRNPQLPLEAATKAYVDNAAVTLNADNFTTGVLPIGRLPALSGDVSSNAGENDIYLSNIVTAGEFAKVAVNSKGRITGVGGLIEADIPSLDFSKITTGKPTTASGYGITDGVSLSGGAINGALTLHAHPVIDNHLVTKQYMDGIVGGLSGAKIGDVLRKPYPETPVGFLKCNGAEVSKTTYADLYAIIGDQYNSNSVAGSGQPWRQQYQINDQQSLDISNWSTGTSLPGPLSFSQAIVTKNRVYLVCGHNQSAWVATVYTAPINGDGTLGTWTTGTSLPGVLTQSSVIVTKNRVYLLGGFSGSYVATVYTAPINSDGTLGTWVTGTSLPSVVSGASSIVTKNRVYLLAVYNGTSYLSTVYTAPINSDGTLGTWATGTSLPSIFSHSAAIVTKNRVYLINAVTVYTAPINSDGTLGTWTTSTSLPANMTATQAIVTKNRVYLLGNSSTGAVCTAPINSDGTLGTWTTGTSLPGGLVWSQAIVTKNRVYLLSGQISNISVSTVYTAQITGGLNDYSPYYTEDTTNYMTPGSGKPWQQQFQINEAQTNDITGWTTGTSLPGVVAGMQTIVTKNRVYLLGGHNGTVSISTVYTAPINTDGTLGTWTTGTSLPGTLYLSQAIVTKNRVYLLGGFTSGGIVSVVYTAPINSDGTIGTWTTGTSLPITLRNSQAIVTKNRVYLISGNDGTNIITSVYTAPINSDGTLGTWVSTTSLPGVLGYSQAIITRNRIYLCGGTDATGIAISTVYTATINSDGTIGAWSTSASLPGNLRNSQAIVTKNRVYLIGGINASVTTSTVYIAPINNDGTLGAWTTGTSLPGPLSNSSVIITKNRIYMLGGADAAIINSTVYTAPILEGLNDYSPYYDGTILPIEPITPSTVFKIPDHSATDNNGVFHYIKY